MIIGIDLDDTLTCLLKPKIKTAKKYIKLHNLKAKLVRKDSHLFYQLFNWDIETSNKFWWECADGMLLKVKPCMFVKSILKKLSNQGHKLLIISARGKDAHINPFNLSYNWLKNNNLVYDELFVEQKDKSVMCLQKNVDLFIDDQPDNLKILQTVGIKTVLIKASHNIKTDYNGLKAHNWLQIYKIIQKLNKK